MTVKIVAANEQASPAGKLADAELHFVEGALERPQADRVLRVGAPFAVRATQRHVPGAHLLGQWRTP